MRTGTVSWFVALFVLSSLKPMRRTMLRHKREMAHIENWLKTAATNLPANYDLATAVVGSRRLFKGYADTHSRGQSKFDKVLSAVPMLKAREDGGTWLKRLIQAALQDEAGKSLDGALATIKSFAVYQPPSYPPFYKLPPDLPLTALAVSSAQATLSLATLRKTMCSVRTNASCSSGSTPSNSFEKIPNSTGQNCWNTSRPASVMCTSRTRMPSARDWRRTKPCSSSASRCGHRRLLDDRKEGKLVDCQSRRDCQQRYGPHLRRRQVKRAKQLLQICVVARRQPVDQVRGETAETDFAEAGHAVSITCFADGPEEVCDRCFLSGLA